MPEARRYEVPAGRCPDCGAPMDVCEDRTPGEDARSPSAGDVAICDRCIAVAVLRETDRGLRAYRPIDDDWARWGHQGLLPGIDRARITLRGQAAEKSRALREDLQWADPDREEDLRAGDAYREGIKAAADARALMPEEAPAPRPESPPVTNKAEYDAWEPKDRGVPLCTKDKPMPKGAYGRWSHDDVHEVADYGDTARMECRSCGHRWTIELPQ